MERRDYSLHLRIEAPGYRTQDGPEFWPGDDAARTQEFALQPSQLITGAVLGTVGRPAANVVALLATPTADAWLSSDALNHSLSTDAAGRFAFPDPGEPFAVLVRALAGFALAEFPADQHDAGTLRLRPWASVRGRFWDGGQPVRGAAIFMEPIHLNSPGRTAGRRGSGPRRRDREGEGHAGWESTDGSRLYLFAKLSSPPGAGNCAAVYDRHSGIRCPQRLARGLAR